MCATVWKCLFFLKIPFIFFPSPSVFFEPLWFQRIMYRTRNSIYLVKTEVRLDLFFKKKKKQQEWLDNSQCVWAFRSSLLTKGLALESMGASCSSKISLSGSRWQTLLFSVPLSYFSYRRMPRFEEGGLSPLECVISWPHSLEPPPFSLSVIAFLWIPLPTFSSPVADG